jgi:hypothetical protein
VLIPVGSISSFLIGKNIREDVNAELMSKLIKIYGERNTGTNYLKNIIQINFDVKLLSGVVPAYIWIFSEASLKAYPSLINRYRINEKILDLYFKVTYLKNFGWKHTLISDDLRKILNKSKNDVLIITLSKNPYSWLLSLFDHPYHINEKQIDFEKFLLIPWETVGRENSPKQFVNPIEMWNQKNKSYIESKKSFPIMNIRYEDLLANPSKIIDNISEHFKIQKRFDNFKNLTQSAKKSWKDFNYYQTYYLNEKWRDKLSDKSISIINKYIDEGLMEYFSYKKL